MSKRGWMLSLGLAMLPVVAAAQTPPPPPPGGQFGPPPGGGPVLQPGFHIFISPIGEPFRSVDPVGVWFNQVDTNHDGVVTRAEYLADAARFFVALDRNKDGEIDPEDLDYYETTTAPEVRDAGSGVNVYVTGGDNGQEPTVKVKLIERRGAARYGWFSYPEPVLAADTNFNRGVDQYEFRRAADDRFNLLDTNHDGKLTMAELPPLPTLAQAEAKGKKGRGDGIHRSNGARDITRDDNH